MDILAYSLLSLILGMDAPIGQLRSKLKILGLQDQYNQTLRALTRDTELMNLLIPDLEAKRMEVIEQKIKSSPFGSRIAMLQRRAKELDNEILEKRNKIMENTNEYNRTTDEMNRKAEELASSGSAIVDIIHDNAPMLKDKYRQFKNNVITKLHPESHERNGEIHTGTGSHI